MTKAIYLFEDTKYNTHGPKVLGKAEMMSYARKLANRYGDRITVTEVISSKIVYVAESSATKAARRYQSGV